MFFVVPGLLDVNRAYNLLIYDAAGCSSCAGITLLLTSLTGFAILFYAKPWNANC